MDNTEFQDDIFYGSDKIIRTPALHGPSNGIGIGEALYMALQKHKGNIAQIDPVTGETDSFQHLLKRCVRTALFLKELNLNSDDIVCLCTYDHLNTIVPFIATVFLGAIPACLHPSLPMADTIHLINLVKPKVIFIVPEAIKLIEEAVKATSVKTCIVVFGPSGRHVMFSKCLLASNGENDFTPTAVNNTKSTAVIVFSSGCTGIPKGICISHYALMIQLNHILYTGLLSSTNLISSSLYWISGVIFTVSSILSGGTMLLNSSSNNPAKTWIHIDKYKITFMFIQPRLIQEMIGTGRPDGIDTTSLRAVFTGGYAINAAKLLQFRKLVPQTHVTQGYGLSEVAGGVTFFNGGKEKDVLLSWKKSESCGRPIKGLLYKIVNPETEEILGVNCPGELRLKGESLMNGYYNVNSTDVWDAHGWLKTGDIAYYDEDFCFYIVDRLNEMIIFRSCQIAPAVIESVLMQHPAVCSAVVIGIPHEDDGYHPTAVVVLDHNYKEKITPQEIEKFVEERVDDKKRLRGGVKIVHELPLTPTGKVQRKLIKYMLLNIVV